MVNATSTDLENLILLLYCWAQAFKTVLHLMWKYHEVLEILESRFQVLSLSPNSWVSLDVKRAWIKLCFLIG